MDKPLSESSVSHKLTEIQKRCRDLMKEPEGLTELHLEDDPQPAEPDSDPYNQE